MEWLRRLSRGTFEQWPVVARLESHAVNLNDRSRGIAAFGGAKLNVGKGSTTAESRAGSARSHLGPG